MGFPDPLIGQQLGDYRILGLLGRGGMARVYRGYDDRLERFAAVKVIDGVLVTGENQDEYRQRFLREARSIARLNHPNIVAIYQFGEVGHLYYMAMVFIEGRDLGHMLRDGGMLSDAQMLRIIHDIAGALDYAHAGGVIHRDVKPSNIMVTPEGSAILTDFGLALSVPEGSVGSTFGSAHYIAPEQALSSNNAVPQSDLYSLGIVLYQMLAGRVPFDDPSAMSVALKHLSEPPPPPRAFNPQINEAVQAVVLKVLEKEPRDRYVSGEAMARALETAMGISPLSNMGDIASRSLPDMPPVSEGGTPLGTPKTLLFPPSSLLPSKIRLQSNLEESRSRPLTTPTTVMPPRRTRRLGVLPIAALIGLAVALIAAVIILRPFADSVVIDPTQSPTAVAALGTGTALAGAAVTDEATARVDSTAEADSTMQVEATAAANAPDGTATRVATRTRTPGATQRAGTATAAVEATDLLLGTEETDATNASIGEATPDTEVTAGVTPRATRSTSTPTPTREVSASPTRTGRAQSITLRYNNDTLLLINDSTRSANLETLRFVQTLPSGATLAFDSSQWEGRLSAFPAGDCLQVWRNDGIGFLARPPECNERYWRSVGLMRWFWVGDEASVTFDVIRAGTVLASCPVALAEADTLIECVLPLR